MGRGLLTPFDADLLAAVATETGLEEDAIRDLVVRHQETVRAAPGVDDLVYEWRRFYPYDPLVRRTADAYYLAPDPNVWAEFASALDLSAREREALVAVHDRQAHACLENSEEDPYDGTCPMVLTR